MVLLLLNYGLINTVVKINQIQTEIDASFLYKQLAENEKDSQIALIFMQMSEIEKRHAISFAQKKGVNFEEINRPSWRAKILNRIGKIFGYDYVLGALLDTEKGLSSAIIRNKSKLNKPIKGNEDNHVKILKNILQSQTSISGNDLARFEKRHRSVGGNAIRAAVLGGNDGLVSNFSLVMGVAGASQEQSAVLLTGIAGLLAGALSMALGEWISVKSSQELYENQMQLEMDELDNNPEGEQQELLLIYMSKGINEKEAQKIVSELMKDKNLAHSVLVKEELGIQPEELKGSAMEAALSSFILFGIGAFIPVLPFMLSSGFYAILWSAVLSALGLFVIGAAITLFTGKNIWFSGFRQVLFGLFAAVITYGIGTLIGVSLAG